MGVGCYENPGSAKRWIESSDDLEALWCDGKDNTCGAAKSQTKQKNSVDEDVPVSSGATEKEQDIKRSEEYSAPQLRLWARIYGNGLHDDLDNPPNVPAITGQPIKKKKEAKYEPLTEALTGAATAITKVLVASSNASPTRKVGSDPKRAVGISPASKANLSGQYLQQLSTLQQLRENSACAF